MLEESGNRIQLPHLKVSPKQQKRYEEITNINEKRIGEFGALRYQDHETLRLNQDKKFYKQTDKMFIEDVTAISKLNKNLLDVLEERKNLVNLSTQHCDQIDFNARLHSAANTVNENTKKAYEEVDEYLRCKCGCKRAKGQRLSLCTDVKDLNILGSGVVLLFLFKKGLIFNLLVAILIFGIFATVNNLLQGTQPSDKDSCTENECEFINNSSAQNSKNESTSNVEFILGLVLCLTWIFSLKVVKYFGKIQNKVVNQNLSLSSDLAIQISNLPFGEYEQGELIQYFQNLWDKIATEKAQRGQKHESTKNGFKMKSIQIVYNMQFCRKMVTKVMQGCSQIAKILKQNDKENQTNLINLEEAQQYRTNKKNVIQSYEILNDLRKKFLNDERFRKQISTACCIIEFQTEEAIQLILQRYGKQKIGFLKQIQYKFKKMFCPAEKNIFFKGKILVIQRAPEPSDLLWLNCEKKHSTLRILLIYLATLGVIFVSFGVIIAIQYLTIFFSSNISSLGSAQASVVSAATSVALLIINSILWSFLEKLLDLEYNQTLTLKIISQMNKVLVATCLNIIVLPMIVNLILKDSLYGSKGLAGLVFNYHITVLTAGLLTKLFNPIMVVKKIILNFKCLRIKLFNFLRKNYDAKQQKLFVSEINRIYEGQYFDVAQCYIYILGNVFQAAFFCHLEPFIIILVFLEVFLYFWISKINILRLCKIPQLTERLVFDTALQQAGIVPIIYGLGSIFLSYVQKNNDPSYNFNITYQLIAIGIGAFGFINPGDVINILIQKMIENCNIFKDKNIININVMKQTGNSGNELVKISSNNEEMEKTEKVKQINKVVRLQNYYTDSNSLKLLGYESVLKGKCDQQIVNELKNYCQGFFPQNYNVTQDVLDYIKKKTLKYIRDPIEDQLQSSQFQRQEVHSIKTDQ